LFPPLKKRSSQVLIATPKLEIGRVRAVNLICIVSDTLRADYLGCYGNGWVRTPNLDRLAGEGVFFENAYVEGLPTIPERIVLHTGKCTLPFRGWEPLGPDDVTLAQILGRPGSFQVQTLGRGEYVNALIADTYHIFKPGMNFHRGFHSFQWIRGQEFDCYVTDPGRGGELERYLTPRWVEQEARWTRPREWLLQYHRNVWDRRGEEDYFVARTMREGMRWLEGNCRQRFFLWLDCFDPHEPWDPPVQYYRMYSDPGYRGPMPIWAGFTSPWMEDYTEEERHEIRAAYAGEVTLVDHWVGELLRKVDQLGMRDDTVILLTSDHGVTLGDRGPMGGRIGKGPHGRREVNRVPLIIRHPEGPRGMRVEQVVWSPDVAPTLLDILHVEAPKAMHGRSFWPMVRGEVERYRDYTVSGWRRLLPTVYVADEEWTYLHAPKGEGELYNIKEDPGEKHNLIAEEPKKAREMEEKVREYQAEMSKLRP